jgi:hypothetical protein
MWLSQFRRLRSAFAPVPRKRRSFRPRLEQLEDRRVPTVSFGSAFRIGPDQPGPSGGWGRDIETDAAGNSYITGMFSGTVDFDPAHPGTDGVLQSKNNTQNAYVARYAADGTFDWARRMGGDGSGDLGEALAVDGAGNVYVVGDFSSNADFGPFPPTSGDVFVTKLDAAGNFQWVHTYTDHPYNDHLQDVAVDGSGNVYVTHSANPSGTSLNPNVFAVVTKLDPAIGATVWSDTFGNTGSNNINTGRGIKADAAGNIFVTGTFTGAVDFNPGTGTYTLTSPKVRGQYVQEGFVVELTTANSFVWAKEITAMPNDLAIDGSDNVYTTGASGNSLQSGSGGPLNATKLNSSGAILWSKNFANGAQNAAGAASFGVAVDGSGNVYTTGYFTGTANFNPAGTFNLTSAGDRDVFVSEWNASGNFVWAGAMGGSGSDQASSIAVDGAGNIYTTGLYGAYVSGVSNYTADFDPGAGVYDLTPVSTGREVFVSKLIQTSSGLPGSSSAASPEIGWFSASASAVTAGGSVTLDALNLTDGTSGATVTQVAFWVQASNGTTTLLGYGTQGSAGDWGFTFSTAGWTTGSYTLYAQATDSGGNVSDPLALSLQVS